VQTIQTIKAATANNSRLTSRVADSYSFFVLLTVKVVAPCALFKTGVSRRSREKKLAVDLSENPSATSASSC
jgi:hypothetical protein